MYIVQIIKNISYEYIRMNSIHAKIHGNIQDNTEWQFQISLQSLENHEIEAHLFQATWKNHSPGTRQDAGTPAGDLFRQPVRTPDAQGNFGKIPDPAPPGDVGDYQSPRHAENRLEGLHARIHAPVLFHEQKIKMREHYSIYM